MVLRQFWNNCERILKYFKSLLRFFWNIYSNNFLFHGVRLLLSQVDHFLGTLILHLNHSIFEFLWLLMRNTKKLPDSILFSVLIFWKEVWCSNFRVNRNDNPVQIEVDMKWLLIIFTTLNWYLHCTVVSFLLNLGHKVVFPLLIAHVYIFLSIMMIYICIEYFKWKMKVHFNSKVQQKIYFKKFRIQQGFNQRLCDNGSCVLQKELTGLIFCIAISLSLLNKCHYLKRFLRKIFPNKIATKELAQIFMWQLDFLMKLTKDDKKLNWSCTVLPKSMLSIKYRSWTLLVFRVQPFFMICYYKIAILWRNL